MIGRPNVMDAQFLATTEPFQDECHSPVGNATGGPSHLDLLQPLSLT